MTVEKSEPEVLHERAAQYVAGSMTARELGEWESALTGATSGEAHATAELEGALQELTAAWNSVAPPPAVKTALLAAVAPPRGFVLRFADAASFRPSPIPGIALRLLHRDKERDQVTCLLRLDPGARLPPHPHHGVEECVVLEGTVMVGRTRMRAGDYQRAEAESEHVEQWTDTGALLYLSAPGDMFLPG